MKKLLLTIVLLIPLFAIAKEPAAQGKVKEQNYLITCQECGQVQSLKPKKILASGGSVTTGQEWSLIFKCSKCKEVITAKTFTPIQPTQIALPALPPLPIKAVKTKPITKGPLTTQLPVPGKTKDISPPALSSTDGGHSPAR